MEGVASEAASLAGHLGLGRLVYLYDDNHITIDGDTELSFDSEDVEGRFRAYGWHTDAVEDANDLEALSAAIEAGIAEDARPTLIRVRSTIAWPAPNAQGTSASHGAPLGEDEVRATKEAMGWDPELQFHVPDEVREHYAAAAERGGELQGEWQQRFDAWRSADPDAAAEWDRAWEGRPADGIAAALPTFDPADKDSIATRIAGKETMAAFADLVPTMVGGSADLAGSTNTVFPDERSYTREHAGRNVHWGVREHAMGASVNGLALHGGIVKPYGATFLQFSDYMRPAVRLSALMSIGCVWVYTHDSVGLGEDGPTHQPVEHYAALRAIPGLTVIRPGDAAETAEAWRTALEDIEGPVCLLLTRQGLPVLDRERLAPATGVARGAYVLSDPADGSSQAIVIATGSEVGVALEAQEKLAADGVAVGSSRCPRGSCSRRRTRATGPRSCRPACRRSASRPESRSAGSATRTRRCRSTASAPALPGPRCSTGSASTLERWPRRSTSSSPARSRLPPLLAEVAGSPEALYLRSSRAC